MPVVTPDDVAAGFKARWDGSHVPDSTLVPNGLHYGRAPQGTNPVYGVFTVEEGETEEFSGETYIQTFTVKAAVYAQAGSEGPKTDDKRRELEKAFRRTAEMTVPNADQVLHVRPAAGGGLEYAKEMREAQNVVIASGAWEVLVQATR
jgi:hypothetical protein